MQEGNSDNNDVEMNDEQAPIQEGNRVVLYDGHTRIITADGKTLRVLDQRMRDQMAAKRSLSRDEETRQTKLAAAKTERAQRIRVPAPDGNGEVEVEADFDNPEHVRLLKEQNGVRVQKMIAANDPEAHPKNGIIRDGFDWRDSGMFIEYKNRFPIDRASFTMEFTMPVVSDGEAHPPAGLTKIAGFMQQFPVFLVRTPFWATELLLHGVPIHIVSVKLLAMASLYLTDICRGYGAPEQNQNEFFIKQGEPRAPFRAGLDSTIDAMKKMIEGMTNIEKNNEWKVENSNGMTRNMSFSKVASHLVWMMWNRPVMLKEAFEKEETRPTPRWFADAWHRNTGRDPVPILPKFFTDEMLQAPMTMIAMLNFHKRRSAVDEAMFDALEKGDYGAPFRACSEVLRIYDDTIWEMLSICRNPDYLQAHREYTPFNYYRRAKGLEPDFDLIPSEDGTGLLDTRFIMHDDDDWLHAEAAAECGRYTRLMNEVSVSFETNFSSELGREATYYLPDENSLVRHAMMVAGENAEGTASPIQIEEYLIQNLPNVMRELLARNQNQTFENHSMGRVTRVDPDPAREVELSIRALATKYDGKCAECKKDMPVEYDETTQLTFFINATTRKDGKVACMGCISF